MRVCVLLLVMAIAGQAAIVRQVECSKIDALGVEAEVRVTGERSCDLPRDTSAYAYANIQDTQFGYYLSAQASADPFGEPMPGEESFEYPRARFPVQATARVEVEDRITFYGADPAFLRIREDFYLFSADAPYGFHTSETGFRLSDVAVPGSPGLYAHNPGTALDLYVLITGSAFSSILSGSTGWVEVGVQIYPIELLDADGNILRDYGWRSEAGASYEFVGGYAVPEPSTALPVAAGVLWLMLRRRAVMAMS